MHFKIRINQIIYSSLAHRVSSSWREASAAARLAFPNYFCNALPHSPIASSRLLIYWNISRIPLQIVTRQKLLRELWIWIRFRMTLDFTKLRSYLVSLQPQMYIKFVGVTRVFHSCYETYRCEYIIISTLQWDRRKVSIFCPYVS